MITSCFRTIQNCRCRGLGLFDGLFYSFYNLWSSHYLYISAAKIRRKRELCKYLGKKLQPRQENYARSIEPKKVNIRQYTKQKTVNYIKIL